MAGARQTTDSARAEATDALAKGRRKAGGTRARAAAAPHALLALQREAGNAAVNALMAARMRFPGEQAVADIDGALRELRRDEPAVETVETGLKAAKAAGIPVELEGPKPPPAALAVTKKAIYAWDAMHFDKGLARAEKIYLEELMKTEDAIEGTRAFLEKRPPKWSGK